MSGSNVVAVKKELFRRLALESALTGVQVSYAAPRDYGREVIHGGRARIDHTLAAMKGARARLPRDEQVILTAVITVRNLLSDAVAADERVVAILRVVEELLAGDPTLAGFPGLLHSGVSAAELAEPHYDDDSVISAMAVEIGYRSRLDE